MTAVRRVVPQVGIDVPARLPGGLWGPPPYRANISFDANGTPYVNGVPLTAPLPVPSTAPMWRGEVAWPQAWRVQVGIRQSLLQPPIQPALVVQWRVTIAVESSVFDWDVGFPIDGAQESVLLPPDTANVSTLDVVAQRVQIRPLQWLPIGTSYPGNAGQSMNVSIVLLIGLAQAPIGARNA